MARMICFDMDGTIADLYHVEGWLEKLRNEDASPYLEAAPMWDIEEMTKLLNELHQLGWEIRVITWLSKNSSEEYKEAVREAKRAWLKKWGIMVDHFHGVQYGATKADSVRRAVGDDYAILVDDSLKVRQGWNLGITVNPQTTNLIDFLSDLIKNS